MNSIPLGNFQCKSYSLDLNSFPIPDKKQMWGLKALNTNGIYIYSDFP